MEYEHKNKIKHDLEHLNEYGLISGVYKLKQKLNELDEVYAKANLWNMNRERMDEWQRKAQAYDKALNKLKVVKDQPLMDEYKIEHYNLCYQLVAECILEVQE